MTALSPRLVLCSLFAVILMASLPGQAPSIDPPLPPGHSLLDDMVLPNDALFGDASFLAMPWPQGIVPYDFAANVSAAQQVQARNAMDEISAVCSVRFLFSPAAVDRITLNSATVNNSRVGMVNGQQVINITSWGSKYIIVHELMHALGFVHEQQRPDRDAFVIINTQNISTTACPGSNVPSMGGSSCTANFGIDANVSVADPYDFLSIMHYGRSAFSSNGQDTITCQPAFAAFQSQLGNRAFLSAGDALSLQLIYGSGGVRPSPTALSPSSATTASGGFTLNVTGEGFLGGSFTNDGLRGSRVLWNGQPLTTTFVSRTQLQALVTPDLLIEPRQVAISVQNPAPGMGTSTNSLPFSVTCGGTVLSLVAGVPVTTTNGCQAFRMTPVSNAFNVVAVASVSDWNLQMGPYVAASGGGPITVGNEVDFLAGTDWSGGGAPQPTQGSITAFGFSPARLVHLVSQPMRTDQPNITQMPAGANAIAFHFRANATSTRNLHIAGTGSLRWKLLRRTIGRDWLSSQTDFIASGFVGGDLVRGIPIPATDYCLVIYKNGQALVNAEPLTITTCFDFAPLPISPSASSQTLGQGPSSCAAIQIAPLVGQYNVVGVSSPTDWDIQFGTAVSQRGGSSCDYVIANGREGAVNPLRGIVSPYSAGGSNAELQQATVTTLPATLGNRAATAADVLQAFEFEVLTPGNYDIRVSATAYQWDLHGPGSGPSWRSADQRLSGPHPSATTIAIQNLRPGWHCIVIFHNGGVGPHGFTHSVRVDPASVQPPTLSSLSLDRAPAQSPPLSLLVYGTGFGVNSTVEWNGQSVPTAFLDAQTLEATIDTLLIPQAGSASVSVRDPIAGRSNALPFVIEDPIPTVSQLNPEIISSGGPDLDLAIYGTDFLPGVQVLWEGAAVPTTHISPTELSCRIEASHLIAPGPRFVSVVNPGPSGAYSVGRYVLIYAPYISGVFPPSIPIQAPGAPPISMLLIGSFFEPWSSIAINGRALPTTVIDIYTLEATFLPDEDPQSFVPGAFTITVANTGDAVSNMQPLIVGQGSNQGLIRTQPLSPVPGEAFGLVIEGTVALSPLLLLADFGQPTPIANWPSATIDWVLGVTPLAGSVGPYFPLVDGLGLFGPMDGAALDASASFSLPGLVMPNPPLGISLTLQAFTLDPLHPLGLQASFPYLTLSL